MISRLLAGILLVLLLPFSWATAQSPQTATVRQALAQATSDTSRVLLLANLSATYRYSHFDSVRWYAKQGLQLARRISYGKGEGRCLSRLAILLSERGNLPAALRLNLRALQLCKAAQDYEGTARILNQTGLLYFALDDFRPSLSYYFRAQENYRLGHITDVSQLTSVLTNIGASYEGLGKLDSAAFYLHKAFVLTQPPPAAGWSCWGNPRPYVLRELGLLQAALGYQGQALRYYHRSAQAAMPENDLRSRCRAFQYMAELYHKRQQPDSSILYARKALTVGQSLPFVVAVLRTSRLLADAFQARQQNDSTLKYLRIMLTAQDSLQNPKRIKQLDAIGFAEQQRLGQLEEESAQFAEKARTYALWAGLGASLLVALALWRYTYQQRKANQRLLLLNDRVNQQKMELTQQRDTLARMVQELRTTQSQLVLREKMASLGELMAGVAHEIKNPISSVKNFAAISVGLCQELREELAKVLLPIDDQQIIDEMFQNLSQYQSDIVKHCQRAEGYVNSMLDYSSTGPAQRQPTDLNLLTNEYMRLTYHDLRLKNRHFNSALFSHLDDTLPMMPVVRQELGRVMVSLFTNAFYAVHKRQQQTTEDDYVPQITLQTRNLGEQVEIRVRDNGLGINEETQSAIFQRFFTTKPDGEGVGLGLWVSYDIITRSHGGTIAVESQPGQYSEFIITLPLQGKPTVPTAWTN
ncbi:tetratricopeptide repeat-containing sensor histidine kinase [Hymenobacter norwichensis]|uniref:tetratricopeptide repeat-containing sensor histidine kinase n=1 Tax=Hymenobacter norwichensis TaxID=223903 RepID=UPI0003B3EFA9|nr:ATP-binding protein [Hymenobacter norwichensis]